jgi:Rps23 Pro-64 3,4-dihydroxylase Tpa1-like proline 4-hydroxylase
MTQKNLLNESQCNELISLGDGSWYPSLVKSSESITYYRNSKSIDIKPKKGEWLYEVLKSFFLSHNVEIISETINFAQLIKYEVGDYIRKHRDFQRFVNGEIISDRVAACVVLLNVDFEGGEFYAYPNGEIVELTKEIGQVATFKTDVVHEVVPVTSGTRYSLAVFLTADEVKMKSLLI